jgi:ribonuclease HII
VHGERLQCGIDEAGRGPVIGPMVMCIVCGDGEKLQNTGARDSKALSPSSRSHIYDRIRQTADLVETVVFEANEISEMMSRMTLNEIELHGAIELLKHAIYTTYVDSFDVSPDRLAQSLTVVSGKAVICEHKADSIYPSVSAASVIAKVDRDMAIETLKKEYGDFGSGYPSDPRTVKFIEESLSQGRSLDPIIRTTWETFRRINSRKGNSKLL